MPGTCCAASRQVAVFGTVQQGSPLHLAAVYGSVEDFAVNYTTTAVYRQSWDVVSCRMQLNDVQTPRLLPLVKLVRAASVLTLSCCQHQHS